MILDAPTGPRLKIARQQIQRTHVVAPNVLSVMVVLLAVALAVAVVLVRNANPALAGEIDLIRMMDMFYMEHL